MTNIRNELEKFRNEVRKILQMDYDQRGAFIPSILGRIDGILDSPKRNCEVGTAEEQGFRFDEFCRGHWGKNGMLGDNCEHCPLDCFNCRLEWAQMPYEEVKG